MGASEAVRTPPLLPKKETRIREFVTDFRRSISVPDTVDSVPLTGVAKLPAGVAKPRKSVAVGARGTGLFVPPREGSYRGGEVEENS